MISLYNEYMECFDATIFEIYAVLAQENYWNRIERNKIVSSVPPLKKSVKIKTLFLIQISNKFVTNVNLSELILIHKNWFYEFKNYFPNFCQSVDHWFYMKK